MGKTQLKGALLLLLTAFIWGTSFVSQSLGGNSVEAFTFNGIRLVFGVLFLLPFVLVKASKKKKEAQTVELRAKNKAEYKKIFVLGLILGTVYFIATTFQQLAFNYTTAGKVSFINSLYMLFVPLLGLIFRKKVPFLTWICVGVGIIGLFLLCAPQGEFGAINLGDIFVMICALFLAVQILLLERYAGEVDAVMLSFSQYGVAGVLSLIAMLIFETPTLDGIWAAILPLLYSGVLSCGVANTCQVIGQKYTESTTASLIMCTSAVFGAVGGVVILNEIMSGRELAGCIIMLTAILLSQFANKITLKFGKKKTEAK